MDIHFWGVEHFVLYQNRHVHLSFSRRTSPVRLGGIRWPVHCPLGSLFCIRRDGFRQGYAGPSMVEAYWYTEEGCIV